MKLLARTLAFVLLITPFVVFGADEFVPLAPIPNLDTGSNATLGSYINSLFFLIISVAAMLAVIKVVIGGFQYMTQTSSTSATAKARETIRDAIIGLILLLSSYLILSIINPQILSLESLRFSALSPSGQVQSLIEKNRQEAADKAAKRKAYLDFLKTVEIYPSDTLAEEAAKKCVAGGGRITAEPQRLCAEGIFGGTYTRNDDDTKVCWYPQYAVGCAK